MTTSYPATQLLIANEWVDAKSGKTLVAIDPRYFRPTEVDLLIGDASKAQQELGWRMRPVRESILDTARTMIEHGVPVGKVYRAADMLTDPHYAARASLVEVPSEKWPGIRQQNVFPKLSATPGTIRWAGPPALGSHTEEVLTELLGLTPEQVEKLRASGIV